MPEPMGDTASQGMQSFMPMQMPEPMPEPLPESFGVNGSNARQSAMTMRVAEPQYATTLLENPAAKLVLGKAKPPVDKKGLASSDVEREVSMSVHWSDEKKLSADEAIVGDETAVHIEGEERGLPIHLGVGTNVRVGFCNLGCWI